MIGDCVPDQNEPPATTASVGTHSANARFEDAVEAAPGALAGLTVLDVTQMLAGPLAATRLGDMGADVLKIEPPGSGEFNRTHGFENVVVAGEMSTFLAVNRNKRSVALNLKKPAGLAVFHDLVRHADVVIQNFRRGTADRIGVGFERLHEINPRLIYCTITGFGPEGPYRDRPGQDLVMQGFSGSMWAVGKDTDPPIPGALWAADVMTGYQAAIAVLAAVHARHRTGLGQHVQVDMFSVVLDAQLQEMVTYLNSGRSPRRSGEDSAHASIGAPYGVYKTSDGWLTMAMCNLPDLGEALDDDWLRSLTDYHDNSRHRDEIYARIRNRFVDRTTDEWIGVMDRCGVWVGPVYDYDDLAADPHVVATGMFVTQPQGNTQVRTVRPPISMSDTPTGIWRGAPRLGADTVAVLADTLGYLPDRIAELIDAAAIGVAPGTAASETVSAEGRQ